MMCLFTFESKIDRKVVSFNKCDKWDNVRCDYMLFWGII